MGRAFDITDYGVCYIEDMLVEITDGTVLVHSIFTSIGLYSVPELHVENH